MDMHIAGRRKEGYITRRKAAPAKNDPSYDEWEAEDALVIHHGMGHFQLKKPPHSRSGSSFMLHYACSKRFWANVVMTIVFLINRMPARSINYQTPLRMLSWFHSIPSLLNLCPRIFGCICYVNVHSHLRDKLDPRALKCVFLGYSNSQKGYKCFHPPSEKYYVSMDVQFNERESYFSKDVDMIPFHGEINSKEEERLWLEEKRWWISSKGEDLELDDSCKLEFECEETTERLDRLF